jgi:hypothetical protein
VQASQIKATFKSAKDIAEVIKFIEGWDYGSEPLMVEIFGAGSVSSYKAIFWVWMKSFAKQFNERGRPTDKGGEELHEIFCYQFLGMEPAKPLKNGMVIPPRLRTLTIPKNLNKGQWFDFMRKIEEKAQGWGLRIPEKESEFQVDKRKQEE